MSSISYLDEGWEAIRTKHVENALEAMSSICKDGKINPKDRIEAARTIDAISDSVLRLYMLDDTIGTAKAESRRHTDKITEQMKRLKDGDKPEE